MIVILERACLETGKVGSDHVLLNSDDHHKFLLKHKKSPADYRPDILHQSMLILLDSPLNKAGLLRLFVRSEKGVLIEVHGPVRFAPASDAPVVAWPHLQRVQRLSFAAR